MGKSRVCGISTGARCAPLQRGRNRNGEMRLQRWVLSLQQLVAPPYPVGARIARPFVPDVITTTLREGARRVIGATAKPLYPIDGKAEGLDRRTPKTSLFEGGGPSADGGRSPWAVERASKNHHTQTDARLRVRLIEKQSIEKQFIGKPLLLTSSPSDLHTAPSSLHAPFQPWPCWPRSRRPAWPASYRRRRRRPSWRQSPRKSPAGARHRRP